MGTHHLDQLDGRLATEGLARQDSKPLRLTIGRETVRRVAVVLAAVSLTVSGCGSQPSSQQSSASGSSSSTAAASSPSKSPTKPPAPKTLTVKDLGGTVRALGTVFTPCNSRNEFSKPTVFDPATGELVTAPAPPAVPDGTELVGYRCTLTGAPQDLKVFYIWQYHTPAKGLTSEKYTMMAGVAGIHDESVNQVAELTGLPGIPDKNVYPTIGGPVLAWGYNSTDEIGTVAIDPATLTVKWTSPSEISNVDDTTVAFRGDNEKIIIRDVASGADTVLDNVQMANFNSDAIQLDSGYLLKEWHENGSGADLSEDFGYYSTVSHQFYPDILVDNIPNALANVNDGRLFLKGSKYLKMINIATGAVEFDLNEEEVHTLGSNSWQYSHFGNYVYVRNDTDSPVLDITTKQEAHAGWRVRPSDLIGKSWILVDHRDTASEVCYEGFDTLRCGQNDPEKITLQRIDNGVYPGAWF
jgi:hypothetical protein